MNKQEFLNMFGEASNVRNAKLAAKRAGYEVQVEGRGAHAHYTLELLAPDGYDAHLTLNEVKSLTRQSRKDRALAAFKGGDNVLVGKMVWYKKDTLRYITELSKENRIRYLFTVNPGLADEYTYAYISELTGLSPSSVGYYIRKIVQKDGIGAPSSRKFRTSFVCMKNGGTYTLSLEDHEFLTGYYGKRYYDSKYFLDTFFLMGYLYRRYQEKPLHSLNVGEMEKFESQEPFTFLSKQKNPSGKLELQEIISTLKDLN